MCFRTAGKQRRGTPNATTPNGVVLTPAWSMTGVRVLHWDGAAAQVRKKTSKHSFFVHLFPTLKLISLPRQTRDKPTRKNSKTAPVFLYVPMVQLVANPPAELAQLRGRQICAEKNIHLEVRKRLLFLRCHFVMPIEYLPRQTRDKHRKTRQKTTFFSQPTDGAHRLGFPDGEGATMDLELEVILPGPGKEKTTLLAPFCTQNNSFAKTSSGQIFKNFSRQKGAFVFCRRGRSSV